MNTTPSFEIMYNVEQKLLTLFGGLFVLVFYTSKDDV